MWNTINRWSQGSFYFVLEGRRRHLFDKINISYFCFVWSPFFLLLLLLRLAKQNLFPRPWFAFVMLKFTLLLYFVFLSFSFLFVDYSLTVIFFFSFPSLHLSISYFAILYHSGKQRNLFSSRHSRKTLFPRCFFVLVFFIFFSPVRTQMYLHLRSFFSLSFRLTVSWSDDEIRFSCSCERGKVDI